MKYIKNIKKPKIGDIFRRRDGKIKKVYMILSEDLGQPLLMADLDVAPYFGDPWDHTIDAGEHLQMNGTRGEDCEEICDLVEYLTIEKYPELYI